MSMEWPLVSLTICTFNGERYIKPMLASVAGVIYPRLEVVVVDDGSTDGTLHILEQFAAGDARVRLVFQENRGLAAARNRAFGEARGEWIAVLDQDDLIYPRRIQRQAELAQQFPHADLIFCNTHYIDGDGKVTGEHLARFELPPDHIEAGLAANLLLRKGCFVDSEAWFFRRDAFVAAGPLDESLRYACDYEYFIRLGLRTSFAYTREVLGAWRIHAAQASNTYGPRFVEARWVKLKYISSPGLDLVTRLSCLAALGKSYLAAAIRR